MKRYRRFIFLLLSIPLFAGILSFQQKETVLAEEQTIVRDADGDMEPLIAVQCTDEEFEQLFGQTIRETQRWSGSTGSEEQSFLDCGSDYGYQDMSKRSNGAGRQHLYQQIEAACRDFTLNQNNAEVGSLNGSDYYMANAVGISDYELTSNEMVETYYTFRNDNPQYFWLSNRVIYSTSWVGVLSYADYQNGEARQTALEEIMQTLEDVYTSQICSTDSNYRKILKIHDALIADIEYDYELNIEIAHSIAGAMTSRKAAVCEGYAKVMRLVMNYYDIMNIYVTGDAGDGHAWNLVQMSNGNYYWLDATWDDQPYPEFQHTYFLVGNLNFTDHIPDTPDQQGVYFLYELPLVSDEDYSAPLQAIIPAQTQLSVRTGQTGTITYQLDPADTTDSEEVLFVSSDPAIISVDEKTGMWTAHKSGEATITLTGANQVSAAIQVSVSEQTAEIVRGDVDGDGEGGTIDDLRIVLRIICGKIEPDGYQKLAGDVTDDGEVEIDDLRKILRFVCGKIDEL